MKKTSTLALSLLLAAGAWCGLAYAAEGDAATSTDVNTATFDFTTNDYGLKLLSGSTQEYAEEWTATEGSIVMTLDKASGNGCRLWDAKGSHELRLYKNSNLEITAKDGAKITEIIITGTNTAISNVTVNDNTANSEENKVATFTLESVDKATISTTANAYFSSIEVKYTGGEPAKERIEPELHYYGEFKPVYEVILGERVSFPYFYTDAYVPITLTSSNEDVVKINYGYPEVVGLGVATITVTTQETEEYLSVSTSYKIIVLQDGTVYYSEMGEDFTFENPEDAEIWKHDAKYGLSANGMINKVTHAAEVMAVSPDITIKEGWGATLTFDEAINWLKENPVANSCKVYIGIKGEKDEEVGISHVDFQGTPAAATAIFDLQGRRVSEPTNGVYIINGKKVLVKNGNVPAMTAAATHDGGDIEIPGDEDPETPETPAEEEATYEWVELADAVTAPESDSWDFYANKPIDLSEYSGKTIKIGFKYISTESACCAWEIKNINVIIIDPLKDKKDAAIAEVQKYVDLLNDPYSGSITRNLPDELKPCETEEEINQVIADNLRLVENMFYSKIEVNFTWNVDEKYVSLANGAAEGASPWQLAAYSNDAIFNSERVNERQGGWLSAKAGEEEGEASADRKSNDEDAVMIQNVVSGLYLAQPTAAGEPVLSTADKAAAGYFVVKCTDDVITLADDATGLYIIVDPAKGLIASETPAMMDVANLTTWDKDSEYKVVPEFPGAEYVDWDWKVTEVKTVTIAVSPEVKLSGIGGITISYAQNYFSNTEEICTVSAAELAKMTPVKGEGHTLEYTMEGPTKVPFEANIYTIELPEAQTKGGQYRVEILEGTFCIESDGVFTYSEETSTSVTIEGEEETSDYFDLIVTPAEGEVTEISTITITSEKGICMINNEVWTLDPEMRPIVKLTDVEGNTIKEWNADEVQDCDTRKDWDAPNLYELHLDEAITAAGMYFLIIDAELFDNDEAVSNEVFYTYVIK